MEHPAPKGFVLLNRTRRCTECQLWCLMSLMGMLWYCFQCRWILRLSENWKNHMQYASQSMILLKGFNKILWSCLWLPAHWFGHFNIGTLHCVLNEREWRLSRSWGTGTSRICTHAGYIHSNTMPSERTPLTIRADLHWWLELGISVTPTGIYCPLRAPSCRQTVLIGSCSLTCVGSFQQLGRARDQLDLVLVGWGSGHHWCYACYPWYPHGRGLVGDTDKNEQEISNNYSLTLLNNATVKVHNTATSII